MPLENAGCYRKSGGGNRRSSEPFLVAGAVARSYIPQTVQTSPDVTVLLGSFNLGGVEIILILALVLILFCSDTLPYPRSVKYRTAREKQFLINYQYQLL